MNAIENNLQEAVETVESHRSLRSDAQSTGDSEQARSPQPQSHLHPTPSFNLADHPVPNGHEEIWRFTPLRRLQDLLDGEDAEGELDYKIDAPVGVSVSELSLAEARLLGALAPEDRTSAVAANKAEHVMRFDFAANTRFEQPLIIDITGESAATRAYDSYLFTVGANAEAAIMLRMNGSARYSDFITLVAGDGAKVNFVIISDWAEDAVQAGQFGISVGRDAHVKTVVATLGGSLVRLSSVAEYKGPGGQLEQYGVYFADAGQHVEHRLFVDHNQPSTYSRVDYRGALQGDGAHAVWVGDVLIRKVAEGIDTYESNKNLLLTDGCRADSVPNLEIETGEIQGAGHSSSTGRFDDEQLFYLRSRGIPEKEARKLVVHGFFADIIHRIGIPQVEERLLAEIEKELALVLG
ncbi:MAG: Fe-S cluster assembly protein SufD [Propionibacteriaceae bacterium]|jgi:Fe-S cluster assembly protein SufD|nr:Fe-S cluster assembly protein SufD [Propionibacteriaceae bacterium]